MESCSYGNRDFMEKMGVKMIGILIISPIRYGIYTRRRLWIGGLDHSKVFLNIAICFLYNIPINNR